MINKTFICFKGSFPGYAALPTNSAQNNSINSTYSQTPINLSSSTSKLFRNIGDFDSAQINNFDYNGTNFALKKEFDESVSNNNYLPIPQKGNFIVPF